jgi:Tol biopolymer transport system component
VPLAPSSRLGPYEVVAPLGAGGMGEVYRARDTRLNRDVALKVLPDIFAGDHERLARFEREAQVLASLNHPNIATLHGLEDSAGVRALVMELVEGHDLKGPLPLDEALPIARQIADALEYAHERGVVHRDLKPANIKITPEGKVKVLDFGLAKALADDSSTVSGHNSPTISFAATRAGVVLGTAAYMSPEQARGKTVDRRADIWAFGVVLCEMLTGRPVYSGETAVETLASVMRDDPAIPETPVPIAYLLRRCLERDPRQRLRDIGEARILLEGGSIPGVPGEQRRPRRLWMGAAAMLAVALAVVTALYLRRPAPASPPVVRFHVGLPEGTELWLESGAMSPDGKAIAFAAASGGRVQLWVRGLDQTAPRPLPGTDGAARPFWSPDSRSICFFAYARLRRVDLQGGPPQNIADAASFGNISGTWNREGIIVFAGGGLPMTRVAAAGGPATPIGPVGSFAPRFLPDGQHLLYTVVSGASLGYETWMARAGAKSLEDSRRLLVSDAFAVYAPGVDGAKGHLLFPRGSSLLAQMFDPVRGQLEGDPVPIGGEAGDVVRFGFLSPSDNGGLAYSSSSQPRTQLTWIGRDGRVIGAVGPPGYYRDPALSPDGTRAAVVSSDGRTDTDLWVYDLARGVGTRLTFTPESELAPVWTPDGATILFSAARKGVRQVYRKLASGAGAEEPVIESEFNKVPYSVSSDGKLLVYSDQRPGGHGGLTVHPLAGEGKPERFLWTPFNEAFARLSPDQRWMLYNTNDSGQHQVFVQPWPPTGGKWQISNEGGEEAHWRRDGKEIYFRQGNRIYSAPVQVGAALTPGVPKMLFETRLAQGVQLGVYSPAADGSRFLVVKQVDEARPAPITVVLNWAAALGR